MSKLGIVYIWRDKKTKMYYIGCHWGSINDSYICSSRWMSNAYERRPWDFKRRILNVVLTKQEMYTKEQEWFDLIKESEIGKRYYNLNLKNDSNHWHAHNERVREIGPKIGASNTGKRRPCTEERARKISEGKKRAFQIRRETLGYAIPPELTHKYKENRSKRKPNTDEQKRQIGISSKKAWARRKGQLDV